jgi:hypothetical protein
MLYATPLTGAQMEKLGFGRQATAVPEPDAVPTEHALLSSYPNP